MSYAPTTVHGQKRKRRGSGLGGRSYLRLLNVEAFNPNEKDIDPEERDRRIRVMRDKRAFDQAFRGTRYQPPKGKS